jgi:protein gp37
MWDRLTLPLSWRKPALIFGNSTSDLFHEGLDGDSIAQIFAVAVAAHHLRGHTTQFLTKRADRMRELLNDDDWWDVVNAYASMHVMERVDPLDRRSDDARATLDDYGPDKPAPGVWLGVSIEDRPALLQRAGDLRHTPAAVRFFSCEPLIGELGDVLLDGIDWVICGGESGHGARPMHPEWARSLRDQCAAAGVPFFFKQWGEWAPGENALTGQRSTTRVADLDQQGWFFSEVTVRQGEEMHRGDEPDLWRLGKKGSSRRLDGAHHDGMPS